MAYKIEDVEVRLTILDPKSGWDDPPVDDSLVVGLFMFKAGGEFNVMRVQHSQFVAALSDGTKFSAVTLAEAVETEATTNNGG